MSFRTSLSDFQLEYYNDQRSNVLLSFQWIIWIISVLSLNIVLLNFIIAVISQSYERTIQLLKSKIYRLKA